MGSMEPGAPHKDFLMRVWQNEWRAGKLAWCINTGVVAVHRVEHPAGRLHPHFRLRRFQRLVAHRLRSLSLSLSVSLAYVEAVGICRTLSPFLSGCACFSLSLSPSLSICFGRCASLSVSVCLSACLARLSLSACVSVCPLARLSALSLLSTRMCGLRPVHPPGDRLATQLLAAGAGELAVSSLLVLKYSVAVRRLSVPALLAPDDRARLDSPARRSRSVS